MLFKEVKLKSHLCKSRGLFFAQEQQVLACFLDAVMTNPDDAWAFVSTVYSPKLDLEKLRDILGSGAKIKVSKAMYINESKNCCTRSIYVKNVALLHLQMVKDNGAWKIYGMETQEECVKY